MKRFFAALAVLGIVLSPLVSGVGATSNHSITIDGINNGWTSDESFSCESADNAYFTWDADYIYFGISDAEADYGNLATFMYIDADPKTTPADSGYGTTNGFSWYDTITLPFRADYTIVWKNYPGQDYIEVRQWTDSAWNQVAFSNSTTLGSYPYNVQFAVTGDSDYREVKVKRSIFGSPDHIYIASQTTQNYGDSGKYKYFFWPSDAATAGTGNKTLSSYFGFVLVDDIAPNFSGHKDTYPTGTNGSSTDFNSTTAWIGGVVPQSNTTAYVRSGHSVTMSASATVKNLTVKGTLNTGTNTVAGDGAFTLDSGATLGIGSADGITSSGATGNIQTTTRSFSTGANYTYNGSSAQVTGNGFPATVNNLTINNASGVTLSGATTVNGTLTLTGGLLKIGGNNLTLGPDATISGGSAGSMVVTDTDGSATGDGFLCKQYSAGAFDPAAFTFPVGDYYGATQYSPAILDFGSSTFGSNAQVCVRVTNAKHPSKPSDTEYPTWINRYWTVTQSNISAFTCATTFSYREDGSGDDVVIGSGQSEAALYHKIWDGSTWTTGNQANTTANTFGSTVSGFSDHTAFSGSTLAVTLAAFTARATPDGVALAWETVSENDNAGFNVYRAEGGSVGDRPQQADGARSETGPSGEWVRLNAALIPSAAPGSSEGHAYTWTDATALPGARYAYLLEDVAFDGTPTRHAPITVAAAGAPNAVGLAAFGGATGLPRITRIERIPLLAGLALVALAAAGARRRGRRSRI